MKKFISITPLLVSLFISSCQSGSEKGKNTAENGQSTTSPGTSNQEIAIAHLYGTWTEPNPIKENEEQGFRLNKDGTAESINMATLLYRQWWLRDNTLYLVTESKGNRQSILDTSAYTVVNVTNNELTLRDRERTSSYKKQ